MLLDARLSTLEEGPQVARSVNVMVVKIVQKCSPTNIVCALIRLLKDTVESEASSAKFLEIIMKVGQRAALPLGAMFQRMHLVNCAFST